MPYNTRWRRAAIVSVICHLFLLVGAGYLSAYIFTTPPIEAQTVELDLVGEFAATDYPQTVSSPPVMSHATPAAQTASSPAASAEPRSTTVTTEAMTVDSNASPALSASIQAVPVSDGGIKAAGENYNGSNSAGIIPPGILNRVPPSYPKAAQQAGIEGTVVLRVQVLANGRTGSIEISRSSGNDSLDYAAIAAVGKWRFIPAKDANSHQAVACYTTLPVSFRLN